MNKQFLIEIIITIILLILLVLVLNPMELWMPPQATMMLTAFILVTFLIFSAFIWREQSHDERENLHKLMAGRIGFLAGSGILVTGIIVQTLKHTLDPWLVIALGGMVLVKIFSTIYARLTN